MKNIVITSGRTYLDIDGYASCIAYSILLNSMGQTAKAVTRAQYNKSISDFILKLGFKFDDYNPDSKDEFIVLDVSNPQMLDKLVNLENIIEIIDHHTGFENYWKEKKINTTIEFIGSVCTIIYERFIENKKEVLLTPNLCKLLVAGILDNTLNLKAKITTERDIKVYNSLIEIGRIEESFAREYFISCQEKIEKDIKSAIINDFKMEYINDLLPAVFAQLLIFDKDSIIKKIDIIIETLNNYSDEWMINIISLKDGKSYIIANGEKTKSNLETLLNNKFNDNILVLDKFMLRKEIIKLVR